MRLYIKEAREQAGYSQKELAEILGVAPNTFHGYESGKHDPKSDLLSKIANTCGVTVDFLLGRKDSNVHYVDTLRQEINKKTPLCSNEALKLASDYDTLDIHGKKTVRVVMDEELERMEDEARYQEETAAPDSGPKVINLFVEPSAAGIAAPIFGRDYEPYELKDSDPQGAAYAVRIQGDSMEPYIKNGSIVFVNHDALADGDIGIFCVDGGTVCKQYHKEGGVIYLLSLNRARSDADVVILPSSNQTLVCQGRVITKKRIPVPDVTR